MKNKIANNICPHCNCELELRQGKNNKFYGCKNYPKCRFTKRVEDNDIAV
ncbi:MAG: topoisomerase DNA-binding C4 zinc finger domain-containing protein [Clostridiales bacterium]|jgi:ssDNA-binding Zn-finger/Zn-ribbon topoisomerase 1|nr:topoisomerase DNA-binding C4 zinc finger domain-containing protein [Clostridiales bacterium]